jgi:membrane protein implicated in regulation of membrane protease activity
MKNDDNRGNVDKLLLGLLTIVFITLKLTKVIAWSWLWVLSPIWFSCAVTLMVFIFWLLIMLGKYFLKKRGQKKDEPLKTD